MPTTVPPTSSVLGGRPRRSSSGGTWPAFDSASRRPEHARRQVTAERAVDLGEDGAGLVLFARGGAKQRSRHHHEQRGWDPLSRDVTHHDADASRHGDEVVEVTTDDLRRRQRHPDLHAGEVRQTPRQKPLLDVARRLEVPAELRHVLHRRPVAEDAHQGRERSSRVVAFRLGHLVDLALGVAAASGQHGGRYLRCRILQV